MLDLSSYIEKLKDLKELPQYKATISKIVEEEIGLQIPHENISQSQDTIVFEVSSIVKNQIFMKKGPILLRIQEALPELKIKNVI